MKRHCETCGAFIPRQTTWKLNYYATRRFCNKDCQFRDRPSVLRDYVVTDGGCWEWQGHIDERSGYGRTYDPSLPIGRRNTWAHRVSFQAAGGVIPPGFTIDHLCRNRPCINPAHLEAVTQAENNRRNRYAYCAMGHPQGGEHTEVSQGGVRRPGCKTCRRQRRSQRARDVAVKRLIELHRADFEELLAEEREAFDDRERRAVQAAEQALGRSLPAYEQAS